ncbi:MAG: heme-binding protein [Chloroflexota bacterium]|nr:heme-binding protein [Chloroflexota bacterium]
MPDLLTLADASTIADAALARARELGLPPLCVAVLDGGGHVKALKREDGASMFRVDIATGKAWGAIAMGGSSRELGERYKDRPGFLGAITNLAGGRIVPVAGGVLIRKSGEIAGAVGISGATSDEDEACALAGIQAAGL